MPRPRTAGAFGGQRRVKPNKRLTLAAEDQPPNLTHWRFSTRRGLLGVFARGRRGDVTDVVRSDAMDAYPNDRQDETVTPQPGEQNADLTAVYAPNSLSGSLHWECWSADSVIQRLHSRQLKV
jgi:hypothetical protein